MSGQAYRAWQEGEDVKKKHAWVKNLSEEDAAWMSALPFTIAIPCYNIMIVSALSAGQPHRLIALLLSC